VKLFQLTVEYPAGAMRPRSRVFWFGGATEAKRKAREVLKASPEGVTMVLLRHDITKTPKKLALAILQGQGWLEAPGVIVAYMEHLPDSEASEECPHCRAPTKADCVCPPIARVGS
jgi:hypothetical protein